ncbi:thioredoxin family protein [Leptospira sp. 96542]|nr:thioredoxin family protein [Leptospira sp. 96542]
MPKFRIFVLFLSLLIPQLVFGQTESAFVFPNNIELVSGGSAEVTVDLFLPENRHLYISNTSALSFNKPTQFSSKSKGFLVAIKENPSGDKKEEDLILKGKGETKSGSYLLSVYETGGRKASVKPEKLTIEIFTQWCNSETNKCYEPKKIRKTISVIVSKEKEKKPVVKSRSSGGILWANSLKDAKSKAQKTNQNIFFAISAPAWCGACVYLEEKVLSKKNVIQTLNSKFVSVTLDDESKEIDNFKFDGYPTLFVLDPKGKVIVQEISFDSETNLLKEIKKYEKNASTVATTTTPTGPTPPTTTLAGKVHTYSIKQELKFTENTNGTWSLTSQEGSFVLEETRRDDNYIILSQAQKGNFYALPVSGKLAYYMKDGKWVQLD